MLPKNSRKRAKVVWYNTFMRVIAKSLEDTAGAARVLLSQLEPAKDHATVLGLVGDLGSGKTTFTQAFAKALGVKEVVTSPTFVIEKFYPLPSGQNFRRLVHIDTYRLGQPEELARLRFNELLRDPQTLIMIEWAEKVEILLPTDYRRLNFKFIDETTREIIW